jgi:hypothetical protein
MQNNCQDWFPDCNWLWRNWSLRMWTGDTAQCLVPVKAKVPFGSVYSMWISWIRHLQLDSQGRISHGVWPNCLHLVRMCVQYNVLPCQVIVLVYLNELNLGTSTCCPVHSFHGMFLDDPSRIASLCWGLDRRCSAANVELSSFPEHTVLSVRVHWSHLYPIVDSLSSGYEDSSLLGCGKVSCGIWLQPLLMVSIFRIRESKNQNVSNCFPLLQHAALKISCL